VLFEAFTPYLDAHASAADAIHVWSFAAVCRDDNELASGKRPDENGLVPRAALTEQQRHAEPVAAADDGVG
jgi:hypothetical protein